MNSHLQFIFISLALSVFTQSVAAEKLHKVSCPQAADTAIVETNTINMVSRDSICSVHINVPVVSGVQNSLAEIRINAFLNKSFMYFPEWFNYESCDYEIVMTYESGYKVSLNTKNLLSIVHSFYEYSGGAHGYFASTGYNFLISSGDLMLLTDVIRDDRLEEFFKLAEDILKVKYETNSLSEAGLFEDELPVNPKQDFFLTGKEIVLQYDPYEIAPYYFGEVEVNIPYSEVIHIMTSKFLSLIEL